MYVHRLVLLSYVWYSKMEVNHIDCNRSNNHISNLEYVTKSENMKHCVNMWNHFCPTKQPWYISPQSKKIKYVFMWNKWECFWYRKLSGIVWMNEDTLRARIIKWKQIKDLLILEIK